MGERKYASDYRLEESVSPSGGRVTRRVYQGTWYRFPEPQDAVRALGRRFLLSSGGVLASLLPLLLNNTPIGRTAYVLLPMAFALIPLYQIAAVGVRLSRYAPPMTRQDRDLTEGRLVALPWLTGLLGITLAGSIVYWVLKGLEPGELLCVAGVALGFALSLASLPLRRRVKATEG